MKYLLSQVSKDVNVIVTKTSFLPTMERSKEPYPIAWCALLIVLYWSAGNTLHHTRKTQSSAGLLHFIPHKK